MSRLDAVSVPATSNGSESRNPYRPGTFLHGLVHEALTGEEILPSGDPCEDERWTITGNLDATSEPARIAPDGPSREVLARAREILERVASTPHCFDSLEVTGPDVLAVFHELRIDSRRKIRPQVVYQLLALGDVAIELADAIAEGDPDQTATRLEWSRQTRTMIDRRRPG